MYTSLTDRKLWFDGSTTVDPSVLLDLVKRKRNLDNVFVSSINTELDKYNKLVGVDKRITVKPHCNDLDFSWNIPQKYKTLDVVDYIVTKFYSEFHFDGLTVAEIEKRELRIAQELELYKQHNLYNVLRLMVYIIDTFKTHNIVWGVGRGSSVSSYVLYLLEVHDIDSVEHDLDIEDFIKP